MKINLPSINKKITLYNDTAIPETYIIKNIRFDMFSSRLFCAASWAFYKQILNGSWMIK